MGGDIFTYKTCHELLYARVQWPNILYSIKYKYYDNL